MAKPRAHEARAIAAAAFCDPRTVKKALAGETVSPLPLARIRNALEKMRRTDLIAALASASHAPHPPQAA